MGSGGLSNPPVPEVWEMCSLPEGGWGWGRWWVAQILYALWHMLLSMRAWAWGGGGGRGKGAWVGFCRNRWVNERNGFADESYRTHTLQKDTTPSSWRQTERGQERKTGGRGRGRGREGRGWREQKTQRQGDKTQKSKTGVRYRKERNMHVSREEAQVCLFSGWTDRQLNSRGEKNLSWLFKIQQTDTRGS